MYYCLNDNVYLVKGKSKDCIYDLNSRNLYHISKEISALLEKIGSSCVDELILTDEENAAIENFKNINLLTVTNKIKPLFSLKELKSDFTIKFAWIEIGTFCNLKCKHCYNESSSKCHETMSLDDFKVVCQELLDIGVKRVQLIGGEPFCHKNIREMLEHMVGRFEFIEIFTNGNLINELWCEFLSRHNIHIAISIYSYRAEEHDKVTSQKGSHNKAVRAIGLLRKHNIPCRIATVYMKGVSVGERNTDLYKINPKKDIIRMVGRGNINLLTPELLRRKLITKETFSQALNPNVVIRNANYNRCFSSKLYIAANLEVYPCVMERRFSHGSLRGNHLKNLIKRDIQEFSKDKVEGCKDCELRYACYDCRPDSLSDNIYTKPYYCTYDVDKGEFVSADVVINGILSNEISVE